MLLQMMLLVLPQISGRGGILLILKINVQCTYDPLYQNSEEANFTKGLEELIEQIKRLHPESESDAPDDKAQVGGSPFRSFPCPRLAPSPSKPTSVHQLRPGDIDVVAALGDSYTAAKAAGGQGLSSLLHDYRGLSWSCGGDGTFQTLHSLPNILKEYNPDVYGFSNSIGNYMSPEAGFNVAVSGATSTGLTFQTALLIQRLKNDPVVDFQNDWKLITILIGGNDICRSCYSYYNPRIYHQHLKTVLDMLQMSVPRAFVNLVELMPVELVRQLPRGFVCERLQNYYCQCAVFPRSEEDFKELIQERREFQKLTEDLISSGVYEKSDNFTVVLQPFYRNATIPTIPETGDIDYSLLAVDCFHLSAKGQSLAGLNLWNNMLQPVNNKSIEWVNTGKILCPSESHPFLATRKNSQLWRRGDALKSYTLTQGHKVGNKDAESPAEIINLAEDGSSPQYSDDVLRRDSTMNPQMSNKPTIYDVEHLGRSISIMIIATVAFFLLVILVAILYYGIRFLRYVERGPYKEI